MVAFGAKLSLKDNMYATLQKNLNMQKKFSKQVKDTDKSVQNLGKRKANPLIQLKDKASKPLKTLTNTLKTVGKTVAKPFIAIKDGATKLMGNIKNGLKSIGSMTAKATIAVKDMATAGLNKIKNLLGSLAKGATVAVTMAGGAIGAGAISEGAKLQQSTGGVETLFKENAGIVKDNADKAYKTAGLSANAYMETVTSFSASLLQSLGGDTLKASMIADRAIIDMADNANKFGTDMSSIQTAYQGFAKQNYTMLDNLKLGYGGTKEEMARLIKEASEMTSVQDELGITVDASSMSFDNIINAISVVQKNMGVMGATANEASTTFTGSFNAMKASAQNLLGNLATGGDIKGAMEQLVSSALTFLVDNFLPMVFNILAELPNALSTGITKLAPKLKEIGGTVLVNLQAGIIGLLPSSMQGIAMSIFGSLGKIFSSITGLISSVAPKISEKFSGIFGDGGGFLDHIVRMVEMSMPLVEDLILGIADVIVMLAPLLSDLGKMFEDVFPSISNLIRTVINATMPVLGALVGIFQQIIPIITDIIITFTDILAEVFPIVSQIITAVLTAITPIIQAFGNVIQMILPVVKNIILAVASAIQSVLPQISQLFAEVGQKIADIITNVIVPIIQTFSSVFQKLIPIIGPIIETIMSVICGAWDVISPVLDLIMSVFRLVWGVVDPILNAIADLVVWVWNKISPVVKWITNALSSIGDALSSVTGWISSGVDSISNFFGFAYGKDRVPYDNYPAILHQGEKVLTRNQADQYERQMSTRGVKLPQLMEVPTAKDKSSFVEISTGSHDPQTETEKLTAVTIEKLADTVVIEKEADVDKVVEDMITKFKRLIPNMV